MSLIALKQNREYINKLRELNKFKKFRLQGSNILHPKYRYKLINVISDYSSLSQHTLNKLFEDKVYLEYDFIDRLQLSEEIKAKLQPKEDKVKTYMRACCECGVVYKSQARYTRKCFNCYSPRCNKTKYLLRGLDR